MKKFYLISLLLLVSCFNFKNWKLTYEGEIYKDYTIKVYQNFTDNGKHHNLYIQYTYKIYKDGELWRTHPYYGSINVTEMDIEAIKNVMIVNNSLSITFAKEKIRYEEKKKEMHEYMEDL